MMTSTRTIRSAGVCCIALFALAVCPVKAQLASAPPGGYTVDDVVGQYNLLAHHPDPLAIDIGVGQDATLCKHYQAISRYNGPDGTPYFFLTRAGHHGSVACATPACGFDCSDDPAELIVARMGSRPKHGERMRSNILSPFKSMKDTPPPGEDVVMTSIVFDGTGGWPGWTHAGGIQIVDNVLVVTLEKEYQGDSDIGSLLFLDIRQPLDPQIITEIEFDQNIGVLGLTRDPGTGKYLMVFSGGDTQTLDWYETAGTDLLDPNLSLVYLDTWNLNDADVSASVSAYWEKWQNLNFIRQSDGTLFMGTADNTDPEDDSDSAHWSRLFEVTRSGNSFNFIYRAQQKLKLDDPRTGNAAASTGFYVSPSGQLILYTGEHDNKGPDDSIRCGEIRSINVSTSGTDPSSHLWIEFYKEDTGWFDNGSPSSSLMLDDIDVSWENWFDLDDENGWGDDPHAVRYRAPAGQQILFYKDQNLSGAMLRRTANGSVQWISDLDSVGFGGAIHSVFAGTFAVRLGETISNRLQVLQAYTTIVQYQGDLGLSIYPGVYLERLLEVQQGKSVLIRAASGSEAVIRPLP